MAYCATKTPALDSVLLTSCHSLAPAQVNGRDGPCTFTNEQSDYWNIDDILAEEELVPCEFKEDANNLSHLDMLAHNVGPSKQQISGASGGTLKKGSKVDLPLWLGIALAQRDICTLKNPVFLSEKYLNLLDSNPEVVNLRQQSAFIYENILKLCSHLSEEHVFLYITKYRDTFIERF